MTERQWMNIFGDNLKYLLDEARMTQRELADMTGLSEATISYYIRKRKMPGIKALINISCALRCTLDELAYFDERIV